MSILTSNTFDVTPPSREQILNYLTSRIKMLASKSFYELSEIQKQGIDLVWNNTMFTPQEIFDAAGTDAAKLLEFHSGLTQNLVTVSTLDGIEYTPALPTHALNIVDGVVTVSTEPYKP